MIKKEKYDHTLSISLATPDGEISLHLLVEIQDGIIKLLPSCTYLHLFPRGADELFIDNDKHLVQTMLPALNKWRKDKQPIDTDEFGNNIMEDIPKEHWKAIRRILKDGVKKGLLEIDKKQSY